MAAYAPTYERPALHPELQQLLDVYRSERGFNVVEWVDKKTDMLNEYMKAGGLSACVVNMSGGVDSSVTMALLIAAQKKAGSPIKKILGIAQPIHSTATIQNRAFDCCKALGVECITVDQTHVHDLLVEAIDKSLNVQPNKFARGQMRSYQRTPVAYYVAQVLSCNGAPCLVVGTGNFDEDGYLRYFCKAGDGIADIQLIADLHKSEVFIVSKHLAVPENILKAPPSADLWEGQTDEGELGFTYDFVELFTEFLMKKEERQKADLAKLSQPALEIFNKNRAQAEKVHRQTQHKAEYPINLNILTTFESLTK
jgi:NAD+ synthase (glutamine-hydrolysing)